MSNIKSLDYKPNLIYTDEYSSDASNIFQTISQQDEESNEVSDIEDNIIEDLIEQMEDINTLIDKLPGDASDIVGEVFDPIIDFVKEELSDKKIETIPEEEEWTYVEDYEIDPYPGTLPPDRDDTDITSPVDEDDFLSYRKIIFECLGLINNIKNCL